MKYTVLGACGMAGHIVSAYLREQNHEVLGVARHISPVCDTEICDVTDIKRLDEIIKSSNSDYVINCIGILNNFAEANKEAAVFLNSYLPHHLAAATSESKTSIVHISTDCVFSGKNAPYSVGNLRDGETFYDRSKALGELDDNKNMTLRGSIVGPDINQNGIGLLNWFMRQSGQINGFRQAIWTGQTTLQLAKTIEAATKSKITGIYNTVPRGSVNKFELLKLFNRYLKNDSVDIQPSDSFVCDKTLVRDNDGFDYEIPGYEEMISEMADWMKAHRELYPHYDL